MCGSRPGSCAGDGSAAAYKTSTSFPDETLTFIKSYPLMDEAVPSVNGQPCFTRTTSRYTRAHTKIHSTIHVTSNKRVDRLLEQAVECLLGITTLSRSHLSLAIFFFFPNGLFLSVKLFLPSLPPPPPLSHTHSVAHSPNHICLGLS